MELRTVNGLYVTEFIAFPRSGHHWAMSVLDDYFGERVHYCEMYDHPELAIDRCETTNCQKNHDFELRTEICGDRKYVVQIRNPIDAIASRWNMETKHGAITDLSLENWLRTTRGWADDYAGFMKKWVMAPIAHRLILRHSAAVEHPEHEFERLIRFVAVDGNCDREKLRLSLARNPFKHGLHGTYRLFHAELEV